MFVKCVKTTGSELGQYEFGLYYTDRTRFSTITLDCQYCVYAMCLLQGDLIFLVADDLGRPEWLPASLFELADARIPAHWEFSFKEAPEGLVVEVTEGSPQPKRFARWGYPTVVRSDEHFYGLSDRDPEALRIFWNEVAEYRERPGA